MSERLSTLARRVIARMSRGRRAREIEHELAFHRELLARDFRAAGLSHAEASDASVRRLGNRTRIAEASWDALGLGAVDLLNREIRFAWRALVRQPAFTVTVLITLGLGVGVTAIMYGAIDVLFVRAPQGVHEPGSIVRAYFTRVFPGFGANTQQASSYQLFRAVQEQVHSLVDVAAVSGLDLTLGRDDRSHSIRVSLTSETFFPLVGVRPAIGRFFTREEVQPGSPADVVVLSHALWTRAFGSDQSVLGRAVYLGGRRYTVVGVAQNGFEGIDLMPVDAWLPLPAARDFGVGATWEDASGAWLEIVGRLRSAATQQQSEAELTSLFREMSDSAIRTDPSARASLGPLLVNRGPQKSPETRISLWVLAMAVLVYLIACANVANLALQRALQRRREVAIRIALGASRGRLVSQLLTEGALLALGSGVLALLFTLSAGGLLERQLLPAGVSHANVFNPRVLGFLLALSFIGAIACSLLPLRDSYSRDAHAVLNPGDRVSTGGMRRIRLTFVAAQVALSTLLLISAGLFLRSLSNATKIDLGFEPSRVLVVQADLQAAGLSGPATVEFYVRARERVALIPGIQSASLATVPPLSGVMIEPVEVPGRDSLPQALGGGPFVNSITPDFFRTMGIRLVRGRAFKDDDRGGVGGVIIINRTMAELLWPNGDALGKCVRLAGTPETCSEIIGIVSDTHNFSLSEPPSMQYYVPLTTQDTHSPRIVLLRTSAQSNAVSGVVQRALLELYPTLPFIEVTPLEARVDEQTRSVRAGATFLGVFGVFALFLTGIGLFGVVAYSITQQTREIGIRLALGASRPMILRTLIQQGFFTAAVGTLIGVASSLALSRTLTSILYGVSGADGLTIVGVVLLIGVVTVAGCLIPAGYATKIDPVRALRVE